MKDLILNAKSPIVKQKYLKSNHEDLNKQQLLSNVQHLDVNCKEPKFQMTPLMIASLRGSRDIVLFLINSGANVAAKDVKG